MASPTLVELYWAGFQLGLSGAKLAHWALGEAGCTEPWVGAFAPGAIGRLVTHADKWADCRELPVEGDVLLCWSHPHGADARAGCVVHVIDAGKVLVLSDAVEPWWLGEKDLRGHLRTAGLRGMVKS